MGEEEDQEKEGGERESMASDSDLGPVSSDKEGGAAQAPAGCSGPP